MLQMAAAQQRRLAEMLSASEEGARMVRDAALQEEQADLLIDAASQLEQLVHGQAVMMDAIARLEARLDARDGAASVDDPMAA